MAVLTLQTRVRAAKLPTIGKLYKGSPKRKDAQGREIQGIDLDYFRFEAIGEPDRKAAIASAFRAAYGDEPTAIKFYVLADAPEQALDAWFWEFGKAKAKTKCDGETIAGWADPQTQQWRTDPLPCRRIAGETHCAACKPSAKMELMIPELWGAGFMGVVEFHITSFAYDYPTMLGNLEAIAQSQRFFGKTLAYTPMQLCRAKRSVSVSYPDKSNPSKRIPATSEKSLCYITQPPEYVKRLVAAIRGGSEPPHSLLGVGEEEVTPYHEKDIPIVSESFEGLAPLPALAEVQPTASVRELFIEELQALGVDCKGKGQFVLKALQRAGYKSAADIPAATNIPALAKDIAIVAEFFEGLANLGLDYSSSAIKPLIDAALAEMQIERIESIPKEELADTIGILVDMAAF